MLQLQIIGNLGADAEVRNTNGAQFLTFRVAHTNRYTDRNTGEVRESTTWVSCTMNGDGGNLRHYLKQGTKVYVYGDVSTRLYVSSKDGTQRAGIDCRVRQLELCGGTQSSQACSIEGVQQFLTNCPAELRQSIISKLPF